MCEKFFFAVLGSEHTAHTSERSSARGLVRVTVLSVSRDKTGLWYMFEPTGSLNTIVAEKGPCGVST